MVMILLLLTNLSTAFCDVCCDALVATVWAPLRRLGGLCISHGRSTFYDGFLKALRTLNGESECFQPGQNAKMESEAGAGNLQSLCWMALGIGGMISRICAGQLYEWLDAPICFLLAAMVPCARLVLAWRLKEGTMSQVNISLMKMQASKLWVTLAHPGVHRPIAFIFLAGALVSLMVATRRRPHACAAAPCLAYILWRM